MSAGPLIDTLPQAAIERKDKILFTAKPFDDDAARLSIVSPAIVHRFVVSVTLHGLRAAGEAQNLIAVF